MKTSLIERLVLFIKDQELNNNKITNEANLSVGLLARAIKNNSGLNSDTIEKILYAYPSLRAEWLLLGEGEMLKEEKNTHTNVQIIEKTDNRAGIIVGHNSNVGGELKSAFDVEYFITLFNSHPVIILIDKHHICKYVNEAFNLQTGYSIYDCVGKRILSLLQKEDFPQEVNDKIKELLDKNEYFSLDVEPNYHKDGTKLTCQMHVFPYDKGYVILTNFTH